MSTWKILLRFGPMRKEPWPGAELMNLYYPLSELKLYTIIVLLELEVQAA